MLRCRQARTMATAQAAEATGPGGALCAECGGPAAGGRLSTGGRLASASYCGRCWHAWQRAALARTVGTPKVLGPSGSGASAGGPRQPDAAEDEVTAQIRELLSGVQEKQSRTNAKTNLEFKGQWHPKPNGAETGHGVVPKSWALARVSENDRALATFGWAGGAALCLSSAFAEADHVEAQVQDLLDHGHSEDHPHVQTLRAIARASEEREAVMRKQWSDIDFQEGEASNKELLTHLERDFAAQMVKVAAKQQAKDKVDGLDLAGGASASSSSRRPWYNIKVSGGMAAGKAYLSANLTKQDGEVGLHGYDDESGRQRWRLEEGGGAWFHLRLLGGTAGDRRLLAVAGGVEGKPLELCLAGADDGSGRHRWRLSASRRSAAEVSKRPWYTIQPLGSGRCLAGDRSGKVFLAEGDGGSGRERWLIPHWPGAAAEASDSGANGAVGAGRSQSSSAPAGKRDEIAIIAERSGSEGAVSLADLRPDEMTRVLNNNRSLGAAIDLVGCYLKNYEIDKADRVCQRIEPLCRERGGLWLFKLLNMYSTVRMKQSRFQEALAMYEEYEELIGFEAEEQWELYDTVYRNFGWIHCSMGNHEKAMHYFRRCVEIKKKNGVPPHWFDQWDLGKTHARLSLRNGNVPGLKHSLELITRGIELHQQVEEQDKVMLCKMLNSAGECATILGDYADYEEAQAHYRKAVELHRCAYDTYVVVLGKKKPLTGWCMEHLAGALRKLDCRASRDEAKRLLVEALKVECSKDIIKLSAMERLLGTILEAHEETGSLEGLERCQEPINVGLENLHRRRIHEEEAGSYAALLRRVVQVLLAHSQEGNRACALSLLEEAVEYARKAVQAPPTGRQAEAARLLEMLQAARHGGKGVAEAWADAQEAPVFDAPKAGGQEIEEVDAEHLLDELQGQLQQLRTGVTLAATPAAASAGPRRPVAEAQGAQHDGAEASAAGLPAPTAEVPSPAAPLPAVPPQAETLTAQCWSGGEALLCRQAAELGRLPPQPRPPDEGGLWEVVD